MYCTQCGAQAAAGASFCSQCGAALRAGQVQVATQVMPGGDVAAVAAAGAAPTATTYVTFTAPPATPPAAALVTVRYAGFWRRLLAGLIDAALMSIANGIVNVSMGVSLFEPDYAEANTWWGMLANTTLNCVYCAGLESSPMQGTLGQQAIGLMVTDLSGRRIGFARATGRHFAQIISTVLLLVGYLMIAFTEKKQGLHDMIAGCLVVRRNEG